MICVQQTILGRGGNCFRACLASLLEMDLSMAPDVMSGPEGDNWVDRLNDWLRPRGWAAIMFLQCKETDRMVKDIIAIACGLSPRSQGEEVLMHAVVWHNGRCLWDPHPDGGGLKGKPRDYLVLIPLDPAHPAVETPQ